MAITGQNTGDYAVNVDGGRWNACQKTVTYTTLTTGAQGAATLFTVIGSVRCKLIARCTTDLAGATATIAIGTAKTTGGLIAQTTATDIDANEIWQDATPDASVELETVAATKIVIQDIISTIATAAISGGVIEYCLLWQPVSTNGTVVAA